MGNVNIYIHICYLLFNSDITQFKLYTLPYKNSAHIWLLITNSKELVMNITVVQLVKLTIFYGTLKVHYGVNQWFLL
jgi:hypothetical protein